jgi:hypothetical protein
MSQRRLRTASLVALFAVISFVAATACSSGARRDEVTAGGAAGFDDAPSSLASGGAFVVQAGTASDGGDGGSNSEAEAAGESSRSGQSNGGTPEVQPNAGVGNGGSPDSQVAGGPSGGTIDPASGGAPSAGAPSAGAPSAGAPSAGAPSRGSEAGGSMGGFVEPAGCEPPTSTPDPTTLYLPCAVNTALAVCWHCHGSTPVSGTPYPLTTYAQVKAVAGLVYATVRSNYMPRPPYTMSITDKNALLGWLGKGGTCAIGMKLGCGQRE